MMQITYQKQNGCIIHRLRNTMLPYKIGEMTSMGWKVLNIEYQYKNKFYPEYKYNMLIQKSKQTAIRRKQRKEICINDFKTFIMCLLALLVINLLKYMLGM